MVSKQTTDNRRADTADGFKADDRLCDHRGGNVHAHKDDSRTFRHYASVLLRTRHYVQQRTYAKVCASQGFNIEDEIVDYA